MLGLAVWAVFRESSKRNKSPSEDTQETHSVLERMKLHGAIRGLNSNMLTKTLIGLAIALALVAFSLPATAQEAEQPARYLLLATNRTGTMEPEMNEAPPEYEFVGMTVFSATFGGNEAAVNLEVEITDDPPR